MFDQVQVGEMILEHHEARAMPLQIKTAEHVHFHPFDINGNKVNPGVSRLG